MKKYTDDDLHIPPSDSEDDESLSSNTAMHSLAESILKKQQSMKTAGDREKSRLQLVQVGGPYGALARGSPLSLWAFYPNPPGKSPAHRNDRTTSAPCDEAAARGSVKPLDESPNDCPAPPGPESRSRSGSAAGSPCGKVPPSLSLSQAERCAADVLAHDAEGATGLTDWRVGEAELSPGAIYGGESPQSLGRKRSREGAFSSVGSQGEAAARHLEYTEKSLADVSQTCLASEVMRQYNERTRHRLAVECLAIPY